MIHCKLDHLVMAAADLDAGREYLEDMLGVRIESGGRHDSVGTHNRLLRLGDDQYLEVIAIDPSAAPPARPRWFALDDPAMQAAIRSVPRLVTWVARTSDIDKAAARAPYKDLEIRDMARADLRWRMTFTADGRLLGEGVLPLLIEWQAEPMPPQRLPDAGCALKRFVVQTPQAQRVQRVLEDLGLESVQVEHSVQTSLAATLTTPGRGEVILSSLSLSLSDGDE
jgi:hypothetical protein